MARGARDAAEALAVFALIFAAAAKGPPALFYGALVWVPAISAWVRREEAAAIGLSAASPLRQAAWGLAAAAAVLPPYAAAVWAMERYLGGRPLALEWPPGRDLLERAAWNLLIVGPCEEVFFRGYLQSRLDATLGGARKVLGAPCGPGLLVANLLFALAHLAQGLDPARLLPFFPGLLFGWLRARTGGAIAPALSHGLCNGAQAWLLA